MKKRGCLKLGIAGGAVIVALTVAFSILVWPQFGSHGEAGTRAYFSMKYATPGELAEPASIPDDIWPGVQFESHTCGFHALSAIYRGHGLDPDALNLRFRLGIDQPSVTADSTTTGTLPPDVLRVALQDGFSVELAALEASDAATTIEKHLSNGLYVLTLITTEHSGALHWVVLAESRGEESRNPDTVNVIDSLEPLPYERPLSDYLGERVLSAVLISPERGGVEWATRRAHSAGIAEMRRIVTRKSARESPQPDG